MVMIPASTVHFDVAGVKANPGTRLACGIKIGTQAPSSPLYALPDVKAAVDTVARDTTSAQAALDAYNRANAAFQKARTALGIALGNWDGSFDVLVAVCEKRCVTTDDGTSVGMPTLLAGRSKYPLLMPAGIDVRIDFNRNQLVSLVQKAKGLRMAVTQMSPDPVTATSWKDLDGYGLVHRLAMPAPGLYWFRAAHKRAQATSEFTAAVPILVK